MLHVFFIVYWKKLIRIIVGIDLNDVPLSSLSTSED